MSNSDGPEKEIYEGIPLRDPLVKADFGFKHVEGAEKILELKFNPEKIVRVSKHELAPSNLEQLRIHINILQDLREKYGILIAPVDVFVGPNLADNGSRDSAYVVTDRIHGKRLSEVEFQPEEMDRARSIFDPMYANITQYYWDVLDGGVNWYISDLAWKNTQFVWGRRKGESEDRSYLVDIGPTANFLPREESQRTGQLLNSIVIGFSSGVFRDVLDIEQKLGNIKLIQSRQKLLDFTDNLLSRESLDGPDRKRVFSLRQELQPKKK